MEIYLLTISISIIIAFFTDYQIRRGNRNTKYIKAIGLIIAAVPPTLLGGLRYFVGTDYFTYVQFQFPLVLSKQDSDFHVVGPFTQAIIYAGNKINEWFGYLGDFQYQWIFFLLNLVLIIFIYCGIYKLCEKITLPILFFYISYFFFLSFNLMRQGISVSIFFFAFNYLLNNNYKKYFFWCLVATGFHSSAIIYLPIYFFKYLKKVKFFGLLIPPIGFILAIPLGKIIGNLASAVVSNYSAYTAIDYAQWNARSDMIITYLTLIIYYVLFRKGNEQQSILYWIQVLTALFPFIGSGLPQTTRLTYEFMLLIIVGVSEIYKVEKIKKIFRVFVITILIFIYGFYTYWQISNGRADLLPYHSIFRI